MVTRPQRSISPDLGNQDPEGKSKKKVRGVKDASAVFKIAES
jgi:hypothetical protein